MPERSLAAGSASLSAMVRMLSLGRWFAAGVATVVALVAAGCASPGPPRPPSLRLPTVVGDLAARRVGDAVALDWTTPSRTTDGLDIKGAVTAEICREVRGAGLRLNQHSNCVVVKRASVKSGATEVMDTLPAALASGVPALVVYRVRLFNDNGRTAGPSAPAFAAAGAAPPAVEGLRAAATRAGIVLEWKAEAAAVPVDLDRTLLSAPAVKKAEKPASAPASGKAASSGLNEKAAHSLSFTSTEASEVRLQAANEGSDAGGTLDRTARKGETYRYTAQRVERAVVVGHALELRSDVSAPVTVTLLDVFPPATPVGLAAVPGNRSIDLSWEPVADDDLAGYVVYRQQASADGSAAGPFTRISAKPVVGPAYSDSTAIAGGRYVYRVTAVDAAGNESAPSASVEEMLPETQP